jgi:dolichyl-phosphate-mannose-protein mannosyltransferase
MTKTVDNDPSVMQIASPAALSQVTVVEEPETAESVHAGASFDGLRKQRLKRTPLIGSLLFGIAALAFFIIGMTKPAMMYFDEPYFVPEATAFALGRPNPHPIVPTLAKPPLGKYMMSFGIRAAGDNPFGWRIGGAICGALTLVAIYLWTYLLLQDAGLAALAATLTLFNNFLFVMSRIAMMDAYLVVLLMWSVVAYTAAFVLEVGPIVRRLLVVCAGVLVGFAGACKWNAVDTLAVFLLVGFGLPLVRRLSFVATDSSFRKWVANAEQIGRGAFLLGLIVAPFLSYALTFWSLCRLLHRPLSFHELVSMNAAIWHFNSTTVSNRAITLAWYLWPLNLKPTRALSYLVGNPVVTWGGLVALALCIRQAWKSIGIPEALVLLLFLSNYLQWAVTPEKGLFYYYYYPAVMILGVAIAVALRNLPSHVFGVRIGFIVGLLAIVVFVWCFPRMAHLDSPWDCALGCWV